MIKVAGLTFLRWALIALLFVVADNREGHAQAPPFKVLVVASRAKDHLPMIAAAKPFLEKMAAENNFYLDFTDDTSTINNANLVNYQVFVMLHLAPFDMSRSQQEALQNFVEQGGGWVGIHAAGLTGRQFLGPNAKYWQWFEDFLGGVVYSPHPSYQKGTLLVEDHRHPVTKDLPARFEISDEWYEFDKSPRGNTRVLASADESTYHQNKPMGDHPLIWTNESYRRMIYIGVGHDSSSWSNKNYSTLVRNAILWAHSETSAPFLPMKNGIVSFSYAGSGHAKALQKSERYQRALQWFARSFPNSKATIQVADKNAGKIEGTGLFKVITSNQGDYYWVRFNISIIATDSNYTLRAFNYYEKPIVKGITNDYSKIEYRWWDFRQGKPWSSQDLALFKGIEASTSLLMASLKKEL
jgi:type 1 glutamine amidotransferase